MIVKLVLVHFSQVDKEANRIKCKAQGILYKRTIKEFSVGCVTQHSVITGLFHSFKQKQPLYPQEE